MRPVSHVTRAGGLRAEQSAPDECTVTRIGPTTSQLHSFKASQHATSTLGVPSLHLRASSPWLQRHSFNPFLPPPTRLLLLLATPSLLKQTWTYPPHTPTRRQLGRAAHQPQLLNDLPHPPPHTRRPLRPTQPARVHPGSTTGRSGGRPATHHMDVSVSECVGGDGWVVGGEVGLDSGIQCVCVRVCACWWVCGCAGCRTYWSV